jgi:hypothetical protein
MHDKTSLSLRIGGEIMFENTMNDLIANFEEAKQYDARYVAIKVAMDGFPEEEIIINRAENIDSKLEYYKNTYDEKLNHKYSKGIRITDFTYSKSFETIGIELA